MTYTLPGFTTVKRDDVELTTGVTVTLNTEMRVGGLQETITVTGETPVVDVQNSTRDQRVLDDEVVAALPASRGYGNLLATVSGIQANGIQNSGIAPDMIFFTSRGGRSNEGTVQIDGMNVGSAFNGGGVAGYGYDTSGAQEVQVTVAGGLGEADRGGPQFNLIPKTGGNTFSGTYFGNIAGKWSQGDNVDDELRSFGIPNAGRDHPQLGHELRHRRPDQAGQACGSTARRGRSAPTPTSPAASPTPTPATPLAGTTSSDQGITQRSATSRKIGGVRVTGQLTPRNKVSAYFDYQKVCEGGSVRARTPSSAGRAATTGSRVGGFGNWSPEVDALARQLREDHAVHLHLAGDEQAAARGGVLAVLQQLGRPDAGRRAGSGAVHPGDVQQSIGTVIRPLAFRPACRWPTCRTTASPASATTTRRTTCGARRVVRHRRAQHEGGLPGRVRSDRHLRQLRDARAAVPVRRSTAGAGLVPNQITQRITPWQQANRTRYDAFYVQDQWTRNRLTLQGALRYEHAWSFFPEGMNGLLADSVFGGPAFTLPEAKGVTGYNDIAPRMGMAYDVFGDGKTAIKVNLSKYFQSAANDGVYIGTNKASTFAQTATRCVDGQRELHARLRSARARRLQDNRAAGGDLCGAADNANFFAFAQSTRSARRRSSTRRC